MDISMMEMMTEGFVKPSVDKRVYQILEEKGADALLITDEYNMRYIGGYTGEGCLFITPEKHFLITDSRYTLQAQNESGPKGFEVLEISRACGYPQWIAKIVEELKLHTVAFENLSISYVAFEGYKNEAKGVEWLEIGDVLNNLRVIKTPEERTNMQMAASIADLAFNDIVKFIKPGVTELEIAARLEYVMKQNGAQSTSFTTIIASGLNGAMPHAQVTSKPVEEGDFVTMDYGCKYNGYCSDMTRTVVVGKASDKQREIYELVLKAQMAGIEALRPGVTGAAVDKVSRDIITEAGYGEYFGHGLGHSVGLFIHEEPRLAQSNKEVLLPNIIETVEPGIYIPGFGGVRIEDMLIVTENGCESLSNAPKHLIEIEV
jgi:Xaa-Pro aminopeptidase